MRINEDLIMEVVETLDDEPKVHEEFITYLDEEHPTLSYFIFQVDKDLLLPHELDEWYSLATILLYAIGKGGIDYPENEETTRLEELEEQNWAIYEAQKGDFRARLDPFYKNFEEEDLLAFVEDMLTDVEEAEMTSVARDIIFIKSKTLIDYCVLNV